MVKEIIPSILVQDAGELKERLASISGAAKWVHVDIMDGEFVDNYTVDVSALMGIEHELKVGVHLMVKDPSKYIKKCKDAGVDRVLFHYEATDRHSEILQEINELGMEKGIVLNPETPVEMVKDYLHRVNMILLMSVYPGFSGQGFILETIDKIKELRKISPTVVIGVDGGINEETIKDINEAGANVFVIASAIYFYKDRKRAIEMFKDKIK